MRNRLKVLITIISLAMLAIVYLSWIPHSRHNQIAANPILLTEAPKLVAEKPKSDLKIVPPAPGLAIGESPADIERILKRGELIIAMLGVDNPPFFEKVNGEDMGLDTEIGRSLAEELGVKVKFDRSPKTFNETVELVKQKKADLAISKLSISMKRARQVRFSDPYVSMRQALLINRLQLAKLTTGGLNAEEVIKKLTGKVGVIKSTQYAIFAKKRFPKATVVEFASWKEVIDAVGKGEILAAFRDELEIKKVVLQKPDFALQVQTVAFSDTTDFLAVVSHWQNSQLIEFVNYDLKLNKLSYDAQQIISKYKDTFSKEQSN